MCVCVCVCVCSSSRGPRPVYQLLNKVGARRWKIRERHCFQFLLPPSDVPGNGTTVSILLFLPLISFFSNGLHPSPSSRCLPSLPSLSSPPSPFCILLWSGVSICLRRVHIPAHFEVQIQNIVRYYVLLCGLFFFL